MRNIGTCFGYINISLNSLLRGLDKLELNNEKLIVDLNDSWEVLTEAIQTIIRKNNIPNGYELMKQLSRGKDLNRSDLIEFIENMEVPQDEKQRLLELTPHSYTGYAEKLSKS